MSSFDTKETYSTTIFFTEEETGEDYIEEFTDIEEHEELKEDFCLLSDRLKLFPNFNIDEKGKPIKIEDGLKYYEKEDIIAIDNICFAGDVLLAPKTINAYKTKNGINSVIHESYKQFIDKHDMFVANLECCISENGVAADKTFTFRVEPENISILKDSGFDLMTMANNHSLDFGEEALLDTMEELKNANIDYVGAGQNKQEAETPYVKVFRNENGERKYAFIAATAVAPTEKWFATDDTAGLNNGYNIGNVCKQIKKIKKEVDKVIVLMHWGNEKEEISNITQQDMAHLLVNSGADLIVGSHSHTIQEIEFYKNVPIVYSLGNFIFGTTWTDTMLLSVEFIYSKEHEDGEIKISLFPGVSGYEQTKMLGYQEDRLQQIANVLIKSKNTIIDQNYNFVGINQEMFIN